MAEHPNVARIRDGYAAFAKGDFATLNELFAEDLAWHVGGRNQLAKDYRGRDETSDAVKLSSDWGTFLRQAAAGVDAWLGNAVASS
ncbi:MAG: hypothetical protein ACRDN1_17320 [Trebonia sp.]